MALQYSTKFPGQSSFCIAFHLSLTIPNFPSYYQLGELGGELKRLQLSLGKLRELNDELARRVEDKQDNDGDGGLDKLTDEVNATKVYLTFLSTVVQRA